MALCHAGEEVWTSLLLPWGSGAARRSFPLAQLLRRGLRLTKIDTSTLLVHADEGHGVFREEEDRIGVTRRGAAWFATYVDVR